MNQREKAASIVRRITKDCKFGTDAEHAQKVAESIKELIAATIEEITWVQEQSHLLQSKGPSKN